MISLFCFVINYTNEWWVYQCVLLVPLLLQTCFCFVMKEALCVPFPVNIKLMLLKNSIQLLDI